MGIFWNFSKYFPTIFEVLSKDFWKIFFSISRWYITKLVDYSRRQQAHSTSDSFHYCSIVSSNSGLTEPVGEGRGIMAAQFLTDQLILKGGSDYAHHITTCPPELYDLPTSLSIVLTIILFMDDYTAKMCVNFVDLKMDGTENPLFSSFCIKATTNYRLFDTVLVIKVFIKGFRGNWLY